MFEICKVIIILTYILAVSFFVGETEIFIKNRIITIQRPRKFWYTLMLMIVGSLILYWVR